MNRRSTPFWEEHPHRCALVIMLAFTAVRVWIAGSGALDLVQDEAQYWDWSRTLQLSYYSKGPLIAWLIAAGTTLFGDTELGVRFFAALGNLAAQGLIYALPAAVFRRPRVGLIALLIAASMPLFIASGVLMTTDNPLLVCWCAVLLCLALIGEGRGGRAVFFWLGAAFACGVLAKYTMLALAPLAVVFVRVLRKKDMASRDTVRRATLAALFGCALGLLPILIWNAQNDFISFRHVARLAGMAPAAGESPPWIRFDRFPEYFGSQLGLILPWWLGIMLWHGWGMLRHVLEHRPSALDRLTLVRPGARDIAPGSGPAFRLHLLLCLGFWPLWGFFLLWSFHTRIYANWSAMSYAAGALIVALGVERLLSGRTAAGLPPDTAGPGRFAGWGRRLLPVWVALSLVACLVIHGERYLSRILPLPVEYNPANRLKGWSDFGRELDEARRAMPNPDKVFFFSDSYDVTAELAFYLPGRPKVFCAFFGRRLSQYDLWPDPNGLTLFDPAPAAGFAPPLAGYDAIFVVRKPKDGVPAELARMFASVGKPEAYQSTHEGRPGREFGFVRLRGFKGVWPRPAGQGEKY